MQTLQPGRITQIGRAKGEAHMQPEPAGPHIGAVAVVAYIFGLAGILEK
jgi:hypothetical protein